MRYNVKLSRETQINTLFFCKKFACEKIFCIFVSKYCMNVPLLPRDIGATKPAMATPEEYKVGYSVVQSYRNYYNGAKADFAKWAKREIPEWFINKEELCI